MNWTHPARQYLALMATQAERMQTLVSDLLMLSKLEGSPVPNRQVSVRASDGCALPEEARGLSRMMAETGHAFSVDMDADFDWQAMKPS